MIQLLFTVTIPMVSAYAASYELYHTTILLLRSVINHYIPDKCTVTEDVTQTNTHTHTHTHTLAL